MESALKSLMRDTVTIAPYLSQNKSAEETFGDAVRYQARVVGRIKSVTDLTGQERVSSVTTYFGAALTLTPRDRITLPAPFTPTQPKILAIEQFPDERGRYCTVVYT